MSGKETTDSKDNTKVWGKGCGQHRPTKGGPAGKEKAEVARPRVHLS